VPFYATDDDSAGELVAELIRPKGTNRVRVGGLDKSIALKSSVTSTNSERWAGS
jgi:predicted dinucleotide-binding enzyme